MDCWEGVLGGVMLLVEWREFMEVFCNSVGLFEFVLVLLLGFCLWDVFWVERGWFGEGEEWWDCGGLRGVGDFEWGEEFSWLWGLRERLESDCVRFLLLCLVVLKFVDDWCCNGCDEEVIGGYGRLWSDLRVFEMNFGGEV